MVKDSSCANLLTMFSPAENGTEDHMVSILESVDFEFADVDVREVILQDFSKPQGRSLTHVQHFTRSSAALSTRRALHGLHNYSRLP